MYSAVAQTRKVTGKIINATTKEPIAGATIKVKESKELIATGADGSFSFAVPENATLEISAVGFATQTVHADFAHSMNISMAISNADLGEVVVIGYGEKKKATLTGSVSTIDSKMFQDRGPTANPMAALQGQVPGVVVTRSSAAPGRENWNFQIRGASSINNADPLVVVDGIPLVSLNALNSINPTILKACRF
jgi:outer membrane receptor protein involved in Fe transport